MSDNKDNVSMENMVVPEFSRPYEVTSLGAKGKHIKLSARDDEMKALAERFSILSVDQLSAECLIVPIRRDRYKITGHFETTITQACGVSLEPITQKLSRDFSLMLLRETKKPQDDTLEIDFDHDEEDCEFLVSNTTDLGELVAQYLSLEIDPFPRRADATGDELGHKIIKEEDVVFEPEKKNPFEVLKSLKHKS